MFSPLISVIIPTKNRGQFIADAIQSVLTQTWRELELIIVDDGSTDNTRDIVASFGDPRLNYSWQETAGRSMARNNGASRAQGKFLAFLDSDDAYLQNTLELHLTAMNRLPKPGMVIGGYEYTDEKGCSLGVRRPWLSDGDLGPKGWLFDCYATPSSILLDRAWFERAGGFDQNFEIAEDWDLGLRLANAGCPMRWTSAIVYRYRIHGDNSIRNVTARKADAERVIDKFFSSPDLTSELRSIEPQAKAWVALIAAGRYYAAGYENIARGEVARAIALDPSLSTDDGLGALTQLLAQSDDGVIVSVPSDYQQRVLENLPGQIGQRHITRRRALARDAMRKVFQGHRISDQEIVRHELYKALRLDPTWILNRGVLSIALRALIGSKRKGQSGV
jgi:glycosyltransferase involved in cell wall biosynthesis